MDICQHANSIAFTADEMAYVADAVEAFVRAPEGMRLALVVTALQGRFNGDARKAGVAMARHMAACHWIETRASSGFTSPKQPDGSIPADFAVFQAAAVHPLVFVDHDLRFEHESFTQRVLSFARPVVT